MKRQDHLLIHKILKHDAVKVLHQYTSYLENSAVAMVLEKICFHFNPKEYSNYHTITLISLVSKVMLKILQARLQQYMN